MNINSISSSSIHRQKINPNRKNSSQNIAAEESKIDAQIKALEQKKASLNKITDKAKIDDLNSQIQQKQAEKAQIKNPKTDNISNNAESNSSDSTKNAKNNTDNQKEKDESNVELLNNFVTPAGVRNEAKLKNKSKNSTTLLNKQNSTDSISNRKKQKYAENAINTYKLADDNELIESNTNTLA